TSQYTQRGFELAQRMGIIRGDDTAAVKFARFVQTAQFFERLAAVIIGRRVGRIGRQHRFEFLNRARPFPSVDVFRGQSVTRKFIGRVLGQNLLEKLDARGHLSARIPLYWYCRWHAPFSNLRGAWIPAAGTQPLVCRWAMPGAASARPDARGNLPNRPSGRCVTAVTPVDVAT